MTINCPSCGRPIDQSETTCPSCGAKLVEAGAPDPDVTLVPVFETVDAAILPLATMALDQHGIEYSVRGGGTLDALRLPPPGLDLAQSDARHELVVRKADAARARDLLADLGPVATGGSGDVPPWAPAERPASPPATAAQPPVVVDVETGARIGSITPQQAQFLIDALEEPSTDEPQYYIDGATIEMLEGSGADADLVTLLRQALAGREGMEIRF
jgi:zinc-ribbon domain